MSASGSRRRFPPHVRRGFRTAVFCLAALAAASALAQALQRVPNQTLRFPADPPVSGFTFTNAFGSMIFTNPVAITSPPGETNRLFICEKRGRIIVITNLASPTRSVFMNITSRVKTSDSLNSEQGLLGLAFHPGYATNRYFFVFYTGPAATYGTNSTHDILARFQTSATNPNQADTNSEVRLITQHDDAINHNAGDVHFGPDGYLYVPLGDEGGADGIINGVPSGNPQRIDGDFFSGIIRIDVDKRPGSLAPNPHLSIVSPENYAVPPDNPFIGVTSFNGNAVDPAKVRTEFWAVGLRNPWRIAFDPPTGLLYCGDAGQALLEEVNIIRRGANYGWNFFEGTNQRSNLPPAFVNTPPILQYGHTNGQNAIIGGFVYRGQRIAQLYGQYIYGDFGAGSIFALAYDGANVTQNNFLFADPPIATFGTDPSNGDILYVNLGAATNAQIRRVVYNATTNGAPLPPTLADTGAFADLATLTPAAGIVRYDVNVPFWSDNAIKFRWFSLPDVSQTITFNREGNWLFPTGAVWIKHFELELTNGVPASRQRLETRFIVKNGGGVYGVTYRWSDSLANATLVPEAGMDESFVINESGVLRTQVWHYPARAECLQCHTAAGGFVLGFNTPQLNCDHDYGGTVTNQPAALSGAGYFSSPVTNRYLLRSLVPATNDAVSLEYRVRSYLAANCAQCHQPAGTGLAGWDARITTPGPQTGIIAGPLGNDFGNPSNRVIVPGSLANSVLFQRVANVGAAHMPPLATSVVNAQAVQLLAAWITNGLAGYQSFTDWQRNYFGSTNDSNAQPLADPDGDGAVNYLEYLTATVPTNAASAWRIAVTRNSDRVQIAVPQLANRAVEVQATANLLESNSWTALNHPANAPFFPNSNRTVIVHETNAPGLFRFYRARVFEP